MLTIQLRCAFQKHSHCLRLPQNQAGVKERLTFELLAALVISRSTVYDWSVIWGLQVGIECSDALPTSQSIMSVSQLRQQSHIPFANRLLENILHWQWSPWYKPISSWHWHTYIHVSYLTVGLGPTPAEIYCNFEQLRHRLKEITRQQQQNCYYLKVMTLRSYVGRLRVHV